ncbi:superoxide dismutase, Cu-Zn family [Bacillus sp. cl95]|nr:superoxide dismutase, Cu-Zn family [Bacillus sp. UNCCL13]SFQ90136.1 superoxide dismutase, Cu-Zn family [Bacillus sp. cl95]
MMKKSWIIIPMLLLSGCLEEEIKNVNVDMFNPAGDSLGKIKLTQQASGVKLEYDLSGLEPGEHAIHIHNAGKCEPPDFKSAGNHFDADNKEHGLLHPKGPHAGDLPNLIVGEDGKAKGEFMAAQVSLKEGKTSLFTKDGTSIIVHEKKDDGMTQPAGNSGNRVACGEISKNKDKKDQKKAQDEK